MTRRELIAAAAQLGLIVWFPRAARTQNAIAKDPRLISRSARPVDLETPVALLDSFLTPAPSFFVRSHMSVPQVDEATWALAIEGEIATPATISIAELKRMPRANVTATMECAGNGRAFAHPRAIYVPWFSEALGVFNYTGADALATLEQAGLLDDARVAATRARSLAERGYGDAAIRLALEGEQLPPELVEEALAALEPERERLRTLLREPADLRTLRRLAARGFAAETLEAVAGFANGG